VTLIVTGIVHALAVAGGVYQLAGSRYGLVLLIKVSIFGLMLLMGNEGRKYAARAAFRLQHQPPKAPLRAGGISTLAVVMEAELCIAFVILSTTSLLVMVAPHP
jgi:putative copper export protein